MGAMMDKLVISAALILCACGEVVTSDDATDADGDTTDGGLLVATCFDGEDNEAAGTAGLVDCADPACEPYATCVVSPAEVGVLVAASDPCPAGYEGGETLIHQDLNAPATCEGCGCTPGDTTCEATLWLYDDYNDCSGDVGLSGGAMLGRVFTDICPTEPIYYNSPGGIRARIDATPTCSATSSAAPSPASWGTTKKLCAVSESVALGCSAEHACVPVTTERAAICAKATTAGACTGWETASDWYTDIDDQRTCGSCFCQAVGGDCSGTSVEIGSDYLCGDFGDNIASGTKRCYTNGAGDSPPYSPPARIVGAPTPPVGCTADATGSGAATPTGEVSLCCGPS